MAPVVPQDRLCPILTAATIGSRKQSALVVPGQNQNELEAVSCQGLQCAMFVPIMNEKGEMLGGNCAVSLIALGLNGAQNMIGAALTKAGFIPKDPTVKQH